MFLSSLNEFIYIYIFHSDAKISIYLPRYPFNELTFIGGQLQWFLETAATRYACK